MIASTQPILPVHPVHDVPVFGNLGIWNKNILTSIINTYTSGSMYLYVMHSRLKVVWQGLIEIHSSST